jgi:hypothetical protein
MDAIDPKRSSGFTFDPVFLAQRLGRRSTVLAGDTALTGEYRDRRLPAQNEGRPMPAPTVQLTNGDLDEMIARANRTLDAVAGCSKAVRRMMDEYEVFFAIWKVPHGAHDFLVLKGKDRLSKSPAGLSALKWSAIACANYAEAQRFNEFFTAREARGAESRADYARSLRRTKRAPSRT